MKRAIAIVALLITPALFAQTYGPHGECRTDWTSLRPGLDYRAIHCLGDPDDLDLHVVRIDLDQWDVDTVIVNRATARTVARDDNASFAINGNFFDGAIKPPGALARSGSIVQGPRTSSWQSIFLIDDGGTPHIVMPSKWSSWRDRADMAVQAGPRLVIGGRTNRLSNTYAAARAGVCIRKNGDLLFFATPQDRKFHVTEIARVARRDEIDGGLACQDAMLFDGGHSVNFFVGGNDRSISVTGDPVPAYVIATPSQSK